MLEKFLQTIQKQFTRRPEFADSSEAVSKNRQQWKLGAPGCLWQLSHENLPFMFLA